MSHSAVHISVFDKPFQRLRESLDVFFASLEDTDIFIYPEWDNIIYKGTGRYVFRLVAYDNDKNIIGTMGLCFIPSHFFGRKLVATGFFTGGGAVYHSQTALDALIEKAVQIGKDLEVDYIEWKNCAFPEAPHFICKDNIYAAFQKRLADTPEDILLQIPRKKRADIRKSLNNPELEFKDNIPFADFYHVYSHSQRDLGTPIHKEQFYKNIVTELPNIVKLCGVYHQGKPIAVCLSFHHKDICLAYYGGAMSEARFYHAYDLLYYKLMCLAVSEGRQIFDFGRSKYHTGAFDYKCHWGFEPQLIKHYYKLIKGKDIPDNTPLNPKYSHKITLWRKIPVKIANIIGPWIIKHIG